MMFELAMRPRRGILSITLILTCVALILVSQAAYAAPSSQAKPTSHPTQGRENCLSCHQPGGGVKPAPSDHAGRTSDTCLMCHKAATDQPAAPASKAEPAGPATTAGSSTAAASSAAQAQPAASPAAPTGPKPTTHPTQGRENCLSCHAPGGGTWASPADHAGRTNSTCVACHTPQAGNGKAAEQGAQQPKIDPMQASNACRTCHNQPEFAIVASGTGPDTVKQLDVERMYAHRTIACVTCHTTNPHATMAPVTKESIAEACGKCHVEQRQEHEKSVHGQSLASGGRDAATCIDCHSTQDTPHSIARVLSPDSPAYRGSVASTCAKCHAKTEVMAKYDVPTEVYKTYTATFHGKANILSPYEITQHPKATCVNCHGYHDIKAASDPTSPVNPANLANTCGGCHPGAGNQFASGWLGHKEATPQQFPVVYFAERFFFFFTSSVLTFGFIFMVALELGSWILRRKPTEH